MRPSLTPTLLQWAETVRVSTPTIAEAALGRLEREAVDRRLEEWSRHGVEIADMRVRVEGREHVEPGQTYVVMSNHMSNMDILVLFHVFPSTLRMVAKIEMRKIPIMGPAMEAAEFIFVDRKNHERARRAIDVARERLTSGVSVWIAPEGTRSADGRLLPFKKGGFVLALGTGAPILPITLTGTHAVMKKGDPRITRHRTVTARFHPPVDVGAWDWERRDELVAHVRGIIASGLPPELQPAPRG
ncbi:MAG TPA: lysophospholipid acyltransferase family protein [Polyangiaceae bacterium LLY-WYZ-15_(1-7)]|nr:1-acyl-sn-glycerol-3-phosphate acyltransferase [Sandaracinus sp.]HJL00291.1 lysophospholipid acyltransferase family protein [Polyangiaceae bacterium LLY-WYZ-15_(1-7)]MBJ73178.1 1-acyl-sn-glycerol-3-phosphate acyltransferase [Sandaracinus sp.]HJL06843.1 lysophospholipid acyltransferase family protein [Polyangiaceae bacterium LLY-WYZ-15_(1-7)]HJL26977.1 lysophospholipid acyltransferase family protein [Polyangiaceae bacterium LLY-WYZ-15_(1-7)]